MMSKTIGKLIVYAFGIVTFILLILNVFLAGKYPVSDFHYYMFPNIVSLVIGAMFICALYYILKKVKITNSRINYTVFESVVFLLFFIFQLIFTYSTYAYAGWDPEVLWDFGLIINSNKKIDPSYLSTYPNNLLLLNFIVLLQQIAKFLPRALFHDGVYLFLVINCILNSITGIMIYKLINHFCERSAAWLGWILYVILIGTSGWLDIYYSDSLALIFPMAIVYIWVKCKKVIKYPIIGFLAMFGVNIKPQCIIVLIAIIVWEIVSFISASRDIKLKIAKGLFLIALGMFAGLLLAGACKRTSIEIEEEASFSPTHYLMMGLKGYGGYNLSDVEFSQSFATRKERNEANIDEALRRISDKGLTGMGNHLAGKAMYNYHDGTFGFENITVDWFWKSGRKVENPLAALLTNAVRGGGTLHLITDLIRQSVWLTVMMSLCILPFVFRKLKGTETITICTLSLFGLFMFLMIFEARARYLYIYVPFYICIAAIVVNSIFSPKDEQSNKTV